MDKGNTKRQQRPRIKQTSKDLIDLVAMDARINAFIIYLNKEIAKQTQLLNANENQPDVQLKILKEIERLIKEKLTLMTL